MSGKPAGPFAGIRTLDDLMQRCFVDPDTGCWHWRGTFFKGEPKVWLADYRTVTGGARAAVILSTKRTIGPGQVAWRYRCHSKDCVSPQHIRVGTKAEHGAWQAQHGVLKGLPSKIAASTRQGRARSKVTEELAELIRASDKPGRVLAAELGLSDQTISKIRCMRAWKPATAIAQMVNR